METTCQVKTRILRETADRIESEYFRWGSFPYCVIGHTAQVALGVRGVDIEYSINQNLETPIPSWTYATRYDQIRVKVSLVNEIIVGLHSLGFTDTEITKAEFGSLAKYSAFINEGLAPEKGKEEIALRLRQWADELDQLTLSQSSPTD